MPYVRNLTPNRIRIMDIQLEPRERMATGQRNDDGEMLYKISEDFVEVPEEQFNNVKFNRSLGILVEEIDAQEFARLSDRLNNQFSESAQSKLGTVTSHLNPNEELKVTIDRQRSQPVITIPMDEKTLALYQGADKGTTGRPDPARGGKTLTELRNTEAPGKDPNEVVPQDVLDTMGS